MEAMNRHERGSTDCGGRGGEHELVLEAVGRRGRVGEHQEAEEERGIEEGWPEDRGQAGTRSVHHDRGQCEGGKVGGEEGEDHGELADAPGDDAAADEQDGDEGRREVGQRPPPALAGRHQQQRGEQTEGRRIEEVRLRGPKCVLRRGRQRGCRQDRRHRRAGDQNQADHQAGDQASIRKGQASAPDQRNGYVDPDG